MDSRVERFFQSMNGKKINVIGIGVSNTDVIAMLARHGAQVTACDKRGRDQLGEICHTLEAQGVRLQLGEQYLDHLDGEIIFRTPGMNYFTPQLEEARKQGKAVTSEMEVFFDLCPCKIFAVTGSDGKTTTTTIISELLKAEGNRVHLGGNIGRALMPLLEEVRPEDYAVVELSSFQLISMRSSPDVAVITNVAPNHLDVHKTMEEYISAKLNLISHQNAFSRTVLNVDNEVTKGFTELVRGELLTFSRVTPPKQGAFATDDGSIYMAYRGDVTKIMEAAEIRIPGVHNVENYLAAISAVWGYVRPETIAQVARTFQGVEHRIEFVREIDGVRWYNDSIATSPTRTIAGLNCFEQKLIVIAGGYDKHIPFLPLAPKLIEKAKYLILLGLTAQKIEDTVRGFAGYDPEELRIIRAESLEDAVAKAKSVAKEGDVVTLSPACASFDMYPNFEARGRHFKELVNAL